MHRPLFRLAAFASLSLALLPASAGAYLASPPDQPPREITTLDELEQFYRSRPDLAKEWQELLQQLKNGDRPEKAEEAKPEERSLSDDVGLTTPEQASSAGASLDSGGKAGREGGGGGRSAMGQLQGAAASAGAPEPAAPPTPDEGKEVHPPFVDPIKNVEGQMEDKEKARKIIAEIAKAKAQGDKIRKLYEDLLNKAYFSEAKFSGPLVKAEVDYIRKGINSEKWSDFPTASHGGVPPGAAATWQGSGNRGGGHITMAPGLMNLRIFDHEFLHHSDAGHADRSPLGVNELHAVEPPCYKYMGCAPGMGGSGC